jgi:hypothetical protein
VFPSELIVALFARAPPSEPEIEKVDQDPFAYAGSLGVEAGSRAVNVAVTKQMAVIFLVIKGDLLLCEPEPENDQIEFDIGAMCFTDFFQSTSTLKFRTFLKDNTQIFRYFLAKKLRFRGLES